MRKWQAIPVAALAAMLAGIVLFAATSPSSRGTAFADVTGVSIAIDCDTATAGIQASCSSAVPASGSRTVAVILTNTSGSALRYPIASFNFDIFNANCGGTGAPIHPQGTASASGCTISAGAKGIFPASNPSITGTSMGFPNLTTAASFDCVTGGDHGDSATGSAGTSTSLLSCINGNDPVANLASVVLGTETFTVDVASSGSLPLVLSNVTAADDNGTTLIACDPTGAPPTPPAGVTGACTGATLDFTGGPTATATVAATNTPPPAATATPCVGSNCPTPTSQAFKTVTPNPMTLTAVAPTKGPATPPPPPPAGGQQPGGGGSGPTGNAPGGGAGAGGARPITLPDTGSGSNQGVDWTAPGLIALFALLIGGTAGACYFAAAHVTTSRHEDS